MHRRVAVFDDPVGRAPARVFGRAGAVAVAAGVERGGRSQRWEGVDGMLGEESSGW